METEQSKSNAALVGAVAFAVVSGVILGKHWGSPAVWLCIPHVGLCLLMIFLGWRTKPSPTPPQ